MKSQDDFAKEIGRYHAHEWEHLVSHMDKLSKNKDKDSIHKLRVAIKKLRSLYQFYEYCHKDIEGKHELKIIKKMFKKAGEIRDYTNMLLLCDKFKIDRDILAGKDHEHRKHLSNLCDLCEAYHKHLKNPGKKNLYYTNVHIWAEYIVHQSARISAILSSKPAAGDYHPLRKEIKALMYNARISDTQGVITQAALKKLDKLQDTIGAWHDIRMFSCSMEIIEYGIKHKTVFAAIIKEEKHLYKQIVDQAGKTDREKKK